MSRSESIFARIYREDQRLSAAASSEQTGNDAASSRTKSTRSPSTRCNRPPRSRSLRFEPLESRELLSLTQPLTADDAPTWNVAPETPAAVPSEIVASQTSAAVPEIVAPLAFAPEPASTPEPPAVPVSTSTLEPAATQEAEESATSDASLAREYINDKYYNSHDLAALRRAGLDYYDGHWNDEGRLTFLSIKKNGLTSLNVSGCVALETLYCNWDGSLTSLNVSGCVALETLDCGGNKLTNLNVSGCVALKELWCSDNALTSLDVSGCVALESLDCENNALTSLDISGCVALRVLWGRNNALTSLNVSGCVALESLDCADNALTNLDVSGLAALEFLSCFGNELTVLNASGCEALTILDLGDDWWETNITTLTKLDVSSCVALKELRGLWGNEELAELNVSGCVALETLDCGGNALTSLNVSGCVALKVLWCSGNALTSLDVSGLKSLETLDCGGNALTSLNVSGCVALKELRSADNSLTSLDVSGCSALESLGCDNNLLIDLNVSGCVALKGLFCANNVLTDLDVSGCAALESLSCDDNPLENADFSYCESLRSLGLANVGLTSFDIGAYPNLTSLDISRNAALTAWETRIGDAQTPALLALYAVDCPRLTRLDLSACENISYVDCSDSGIVDLNVSNCDELTNLHANGLSIKSLDLRGAPNLYELFCDATKVSRVLLSPERTQDYFSFQGFNNSTTNFSEVACYYYDANGEKQILNRQPLPAVEYGNYYFHITPETILPVYCDYYVENTDENGETTAELTHTLVVSEQMNYDDGDVAALRSFLTQNGNCAKVSSKFDAEDPETYGVEWTEVDGVNHLTAIDWMGKGLAGWLDLRECDYLKTLVCGNNPEINGLTLPNGESASLETLECWNTGLKTLDVSACPKLTYLSCYSDKLQSIYVPDVCEAGKTVDISKLEIDLTRYKTEIAPEDVIVTDDGVNVYPSMASYYASVNMLENGVWVDCYSRRSNEQTGEFSILKPQTTTFKTRIGGAETDVLLPTYGVVYDDKSCEVANVVRVYGSFFTLPEILLKQDHFDHWKNSTDGIATLLDPLRFDPIYGRELEQYFDLPYQIDALWNDENCRLEAFGLTLREEFADSPLFNDSENVLVLSGVSQHTSGKTSKLDFSVDFQPEGIGYAQYRAADASVKSWLTQKGETTNVYGYSFGAAVAQWILSDFSGKVNCVELYNAPGISAEAAAKFRTDSVGALSYYIASGDIISLQGETVLPGGNVYLYSYSSATNIVEGYANDKHFRPLTVPYAFAGETQEQSDAIADEYDMSLTYRVAPSRQCETISDEIFGSFWFHYDDAEYTAWRASLCDGDPSEIFAIRGTAEGWRANFRKMVASVGKTMKTDFGDAVVLPIAKNFVKATGYFADIMKHLGWVELIGNFIDLPAPGFDAVKCINDFYDLSRSVELGKDWRLLQINDSITYKDGKLANGSAALISPDGFAWPATLNYRDRSFESVTIKVEEDKGATRLGSRSSYYLTEADLKFEPQPLDVYNKNAAYLLYGSGVISYNYLPALMINQELATISGEIVVHNEGTKVSDATLFVGEMGGQFSAIGKTDEFRFITGRYKDANVPLGGAYGNFDEITLSTGGGLREENVNYFKLQNATVVWDKQGKVMGFRECVTITGSLTIGKLTLSVKARYFGADDWKVEIDAGLGGKAILTPENPRFTTLEPLTVKELGEILARNAASASVFDASEVSEKTRVSLVNGWNDAASLARLDVADAPTAVLRCEWSNACDAPGLRFESPSGVAYSEAEMLELGYLQRISAGNESVARSYLTFLNVDEFGKWRVTSDASLTDGTATLYETSATTRKPEAKAVDATFDEESGAVSVVVEFEKTDVDLTAETLELAWLNALDGGKETTVATTNVALEDAEVDAAGRLTFVLNVAELELPNGDYRLLARFASTFATAESATFAFAPVARIEASETTLNFGAVDLDAANGDASEEPEEGNAGVVERTITLKNAGSKIASFAVAPTGSVGTTDFYVAGLYADGESVDCGNVALRPGESVELTFYFAPTAVVGREIGVELIETETSDVLSTLRLNGLGVSQTVPTAAITSDVVRVQEGCAVWLSGADSTAPNGGALEYRWDLDGSSALTEGALTDGDGGFYRVVETSGSFDVRLQVVDETGVESEVALREIAVETVAPTVNVKTTTREIGDANVLTRFDLTADFFSERTVERWTLNWGDGTETVWNERSSATPFAHCYERGDEAKNYVATLRLTASDGEVYEFALGETFIPAAWPSDVEDYEPNDNLGEAYKLGATVGKTTITQALNDEIRYSYDGLSDWDYFSFELIETGKSGDYLEFALPDGCEKIGEHETDYFDVQFSFGVVGEDGAWEMGEKSASLNFDDYLRGERTVRFSLNGCLPGTYVVVVDGYLDLNLQDDPEEPIAVALPYYLTFETSGRTATPPVAVSKVDGLTILRWSNYGDANGYEVQSSTDGGATWNDLPNQPSDAYSTILLTEEEGTIYRVRAYNDVGASDWGMYDGASHGCEEENLAFELGRLDGKTTIAQKVASHTDWRVEKNAYFAFELTEPGRFGDYVEISIPERDYPYEDYVFVYVDYSAFTAEHDIYYRALYQTTVVAGVRSIRYSLNGVAPGRYVFKVDASGAREFEYTLTFETSGVPASPAVVVYKKDGEATLRWSNYGDANGYEVQSSTDGGATWSDLPNQPSDATCLTLENNDAETLYRVRAYNDVGASTWSVYDGDSETNDERALEFDLGAVSGGETTFEQRLFPGDYDSFTFTLTETGRSGDYLEIEIPDVYINIGDYSGLYTSLALMVDANGDERYVFYGSNESSWIDGVYRWRYSLNGLEPGTYSLRIVNVEVSGCFASIPYKLNFVTKGLPAVPALLAVESELETTLRWHNVGDATGFNLQKSTDGGETWSDLTNLPGDATFATFAKSASGTLYRIRAFNERGATAWRVCDDYEPIDQENHPGDLGVAFGATTIVQKFRGFDGDWFEFTLTETARSGDYVELTISAEYAELWRQAQIRIDDRYDLEKWINSEDLNGGAAILRLSLDGLEAGTHTVYVDASPVYDDGVSPSRCEIPYALTLDVRYFAVPSVAVEDDATDETNALDDVFANFFVEEEDDWDDFI